MINHKQPSEPEKEAFAFFVMHKHCPKHLHSVSYFSLNILPVFTKQKEDTTVTSELQ